ncbi:MAG: glycosyltransferase [Lentisphaerae bacterium]|nr:glycosyltransferase [Lentisphaerota bacterium]
MPAYNKACFLESVVRSVDKGSRSVCELIVLDDASTDNTPEVCHRLKSQSHSFRFEILRNEKNQGAAATRNMGIRAARGDILVFVDADARFEENCLDKLCAAMSCADIVFPKALYDDGRLLNPKNKFEREYAINSIVFAVRKLALAKMDALFDEQMNVYAEDADFFLRAKAVGLRIVYVEEAVVRHPVHTRYSEDWFFYSVRNTLYLTFKLEGLVKYRVPFCVYASYFIVTYLLGALFKRNMADGHPVDSTRGRLLRLYVRAIRQAFMMRDQLKEKRMNLELCLHGAKAAK